MFRNHPEQCFPNMGIDISFGLLLSIVTEILRTIEYLLMVTLICIIWKMQTGARFSDILPDC